MAEKKEHKIISADSGEEKKEKAAPAEKSAKAAKNAAGSESKVKQPKIEEAAPSPKPQHEIKEAGEKGNAGGLRIGAVVLWVAAIIFEVLAALVLFGKINLTFLPVMWQLLLFIVLDLACVIIGAQLWKKANHIDPASEKNKVKFWLWNNMGVIVCCFAFIPIIILMLRDKDLDKKTKTICVVAAAVALLIGGAASIDYNPVSQEQLAEAEAVLGDTDVYWARFGKVYHTHEDCQALNNSETLTVGTVDQAIAANRTRLCSFCAKRDEITEVVTDNAA